MMVNRRTALIVLVALSLLAATASWSVAADPFRVGVAVSLTGAFGKEGTMVQDAYTLWMETVNARGGINGHPAELIFYDDKSDPATSAKLIDRLVISDKVDLLLGGFGSSLVFAASAAAERHGYPLISGAASSNRLFERGFKYYFSTLGKATEEVRGCVEMFTAVTPKPKTAAIIGADILFTSLACEGFREYAGRHGIEVIHYELFPMAFQEYNSLLLKIKAKDPDLLLVGSHLLVAMRVMKALKEIDYSPKAVAFSYGPTVPRFTEELKGDAEFVIAASEWAPNLPFEGAVFGSAADFNQTFSDRFKRRPDFVEAAAVGGALAQQLAIERLGLKPPLSGADRAAIRDKLVSDTFPTFYGVIDFAPDGANVAQPPVTVQIQDGALKTVYPLEYAESEIRYPFQPWKQR